MGAGGWGGGVAAGWGSRSAGCVGSQCAEEVALARKRWRPREGGSRTIPAQSTCLDTVGFWGGGAPATLSMDPIAGTFLRMLFLLSAQPWSTLAAGNTCEYSTSFKTYADNLEFVLLKNNNN